MVKQSKRDNNKSRRIAGTTLAITITSAISATLLNHLFWGQNA